MAELERFKLPGSAHFGLGAGLTLTNSAEPSPIEADRQDRAEPENLIDEGKQDASERGVKADTP